MLADGGKHCRDLCKLVGEPLIDGMVVGSDADLLSIPEREEVSQPSLSPNLLYPTLPTLRPASVHATTYKYS